MKGSDSMQSSCVHMCKKNDLNFQPVISNSFVVNFPNPV